MLVGWVRRSSKPRTPKRALNPNKPWTRLIFGIGLLSSLWMWTACGSITAAVKPPLTIPPKVAESPSLEAWIGGVYWAGSENCKTLSRMRVEPPEQCDDPGIHVQETTK